MAAATLAKKRKLDGEEPLEIKLDAPEPPSKKALRRIKKGKDKSKKESEKEESGSQQESKGHEKPAPADSKRSDWGVWIGNLSFTTTKDDLRNFITSKARLDRSIITRLHMPEGPKKQGKPQNKGFAYVDLATRVAMDRVIALSEQTLATRQLLIKDARSFEGRPEKKAEENPAAATKPPSKRIFVGNLAYDVTEDTLRDHYVPCGSINNVHVAKFEDSGKCKGYAWVTFDELEAAEAAVRGFVRVPEDEDEDEEEDADAGEDEDSENGERDSEYEGEENRANTDMHEAKNSKAKPRKMHKVWVNRIMGRTLRTEFAEDAGTRYKKRFRKDHRREESEPTQLVSAPVRNKKTKFE